MAPARAKLRLVRPCAHKLTTPELHAIIGRALGETQNARARGHEWVRLNPKRAAVLLLGQRLVALVEEKNTAHWVCSDIAGLERALRRELGDG